MCDDRKALEGALDRLLTNQGIGELALSAEYTSIAEKLFQLQQQLAELYRFSLCLAEGDIDAPPPARGNYLAGGLKQLHAQMRHLTWQAQCISDGDYSQRVDFMGEFSEAFNSMVAKLNLREMYFHTQQAVMEQLFNRLEPLFVVSEANRDRLLFANTSARERFALEDGIVASPLLQSIWQLPDDGTEHQLLDESSGRWYDVTTGRLLWSNEENALLFYCVDITAHKARETSLAAAANTDMLTKLSNRRAMEESLQSLWELCKRLQKPLSFLMLDIDYFKTFNDTYGHLAGDDCLAQIATILRQHVSRSSDVVARYGGEEFIILLPFTQAEHAMLIAERIRAAVENTAVALSDPNNGKKYARITISCGISCTIPHNGMTHMHLLRTADQALYDAKEQGRNRVCYREAEDTDMPSTGS